MPPLAKVWSGCLVAVVLLAPAGVAGAQEESAAAAVAFSDGVRAFQAGRDADALQRFGDAVKLDPDNATAHYWLGLTLLRLGRPAEAVGEIEHGLGSGAPLEVDVLWVRHDLGAAQLAAGDAPAAARTLGAVVDELTARLRRNDIDRLHQLSERAKARLAAARKAGAGESRTDKLEEAVLEADAALEARQIDERLLARSLRREADALERLGRPADAAAARARAEALPPEGTEASAIVAPPWNGALPSLGLVRRWEASVGTSTVADSNPSLLSEGLSLDTPDAGIHLVRGGESDRAARLDLSLAFRPASRRDWSFGVSFDGHQSFYQSLDFFNSGELRATAYLARGGAPRGTLTGPLGAVRVDVDAERRVALLLQAGLDSTTLDNKGYLTTAEGSASLVYQPSPRWASQADLHLLGRSYREEPTVGRRSGTEVRLGLAQSFFGSRDRSLRLEALGGRRSAGLPFEASLLRGTADLSLPLFQRLGLSVLGFWQKDDYGNLESDLFFVVYDPYDPRFGELLPGARRRRDVTLRAAAALTWTMTDHLQVLSRFVWIDRSSNIQSKFASLDYRREILSVGARWLF